MAPRRTDAQIRRIKPEPTLGELVFAFREARSLSQEGLADRSGTTASYISRIESGKRSTHPRRDKLIAIAQAMKLTSEEFSRLMSAAGYETPEYDAPNAFRSCVEKDPALRVRQKRTLLDLYAQFTGVDFT